MPKTELFGAEGCPYTQEMREWLEWQGRDFQEHDVHRDPAAFERMRAATGGQTTVPVLLEDGRIVQIGWQGHGCVIARSGDRTDA